MLPLTARLAVLYDKELSASFLLRPSLSEQVLGVLVMPGTTQEATIVVLLDWQGHVVWVSSENPRRGPGQAAEQYVREDHRATVQEAVAEVVNHRKSRELQVVNEIGEQYRVWLWPLDSPDVAVCALAVHMPDELALLTSREQDCLKLLAYGMSTAKIAAKLKIAVSTVHTHFKRARDKLNLSSLEALISFAARHCDTFPHPLEQQVGDTTAAVGAAILRASPGSRELHKALERP